MHNYKNSPKSTIENMDLNIVLMGVQATDLVQMVFIFSASYYMTNIFLSLFLTFISFIFFYIMEKKRTQMEPLELNRNFSKIAKTFPTIGEYFQSSTDIEFEEEVYRE